MAIILSNYTSKSEMESEEHVVIKFSMERAGGFPGVAEQPTITVTKGCY